MVLWALMFLLSLHFRVLCILRDGGMKRPGPTLRVGLRETGSALDMWFAPHKRPAGVCISHHS